MKASGSGPLRQEPRKLARQIGGRLYYGRMLMAHVYEALNIVKDIQENAKLKALVDACDPETRASFGAVKAFLTTPDYGLLASLLCERLSRSPRSFRAMYQPIRSETTRSIGISS